MAWAHSVAAIIKDAADEQGLGFGARYYVMTLLLAELDLDSLEERRP